MQMNRVDFFGDERAHLTDPPDERMNCGVADNEWTQRETNS